MSNSASQANPFRAYRTEQLEGIWRFYVKEPFDKLLGPKPLIFEGGRGSGKTMFFACNSWRERFREIESMSENPRALFSSAKDPNYFVGIYYRADAPFIGSFYGKSIDDDIWRSLFATYFNVVICREIFLFLKECINRELLFESQLTDVSRIISQKLDQSDIQDPSAIIELLDRMLDRIEVYSNDVSKERPILLNPGTLIKTTIESLRTTAIFASTNFHIFIDEYETFNESQQVQINTLIKMSQSWLVYDVSVKNKGIKTFGTLTGEVIQDPHDFNYFKPETQINEADYKNLLIKICEKRFKELVVKDYQNHNLIDIRYYLGEYDLEKEVKDLATEESTHAFKPRLKEIINQSISDPALAAQVYTELAECSLVNSRMHLCLLLRIGQHSIGVMELYEEYRRWTQGQSSRYKEWLNNMELAIVFLLCREAKRPKQYYGFDVYSMLSSGIIRYFLELCEHAFDFAISNKFSIENLRPLTIVEQSKAARYVSRYKISDIEWFKPHGNILKRFILLLGQMYRELQTNSNVTLGEPEQNHFYTKPNELDKESSQLLEIAVMHNVLQEKLPTKEKDDLPIEIIDYHINHIYCPYFDISYRKKRKIQISPDELRDLFLSNSAEAKKTARMILQRFRSLVDSKVSPSLEQLDLFEE